MIVIVIWILTWWEVKDGYMTIWMALVGSWPYRSSWTTVLLSIHLASLICWKDIQPVCLDIWPLISPCFQSYQ